MLTISLMPGQALEPSLWKERSPSDSARPFVESAGKFMEKPKHDRAGWLGLVVVMMVILVFLAVAKCQPDFFRNLTFIQ